MKTLLLAAAVATATPAPGPDPGVAAFLSGTLPLGAAALGTLAAINAGMADGGARPDQLLLGAATGYVLGGGLAGLGQAYAGDAWRGVGMGAASYGAAGAGALGGGILGLVLLPFAPITVETLTRPLMLGMGGALAGSAIWHVTTTLDAAETARTQRARYNRAP